MNTEELASKDESPCFHPSCVSVLDIPLQVVSPAPCGVLSKTIHSHLHVRRIPERPKNFQLPGGHRLLK